MNDDTKEIINKEIMQPIINTIITKNDPITCLVLSGGSVRGLNMYGALYEAMKQGLFDLNNIHTIYATSIGTIIACLLSMKFDWEIYTDYIVKRPWNKIFNIDITNIFNSYENSGIFTKHVIISIIEPFFKARDFPIDITLQTFYECTQVDNHFFATEMNEFVCIDISYKTHPDWKVIDAIYASCCLPILFQPFFHKDKCYADGALLYNYPIEKCIETFGIENEHKILGISTIDLDNLSTVSPITPEINLFEYMFTVILKLMNKRIFKNEIKHIYTYSIEIPIEEITLDKINNILSKSEERQTLIQNGSNNMKNIMKNKFIHSTLVR